jgi:hypothetical protein
MFLQSSVGKAYANSTNSQAEKNSNNQGQFQAVSALIRGSDEGKVPTHRHTPKF